MAWDSTLEDWEFSTRPQIETCEYCGTSFFERDDYVSLYDEETHLCSNYCLDNFNKKYIEENNHDD